MQVKSGSWLACDAGASVSKLDRGDAIAGKPAPTLQPPPTHKPAPTQAHSNIGFVVVINGVGLPQPIDLQSTHNHSLPIAQRSAKMRRLIRP